MLFDSLDKIKTNSIFSAILMTALGVVILILPEAYIPSLIMAAGNVLVIIALVLMMDFKTKKKGLIDYLLFILALILLILGISVLVFKNDLMVALSRIFGILLIIDGARTTFHAYTYARRSERKGWQILAVLSILMIIAGIALFINPWLNTPYSLLKGIGSAFFFSAIVSALRLIWTWPLRNSASTD